MFCKPLQRKFLNIFLKKETKTRNKKTGRKTSNFLVALGGNNNLFLTRVLSKVLPL